MRNIPLAALLSLFVFAGTSLFAQTGTVLKASNNGKLNYTYNAIATDQYSVEIVFKNDQFIYKQEVDTLKLHSAASCLLFKEDLQNALSALQNKNSSFKIERANYTLAFNDAGVTGFYIVLSNKAGTISTANNKFQIKVLLEWLNSFEFGK